MLRLLGLAALLLVGGVEDPPDVAIVDRPRLRQLPVQIRQQRVPLRIKGLPGPFRWGGVGGSP